MMDQHLGKYYLGKNYAFTAVSLTNEYEKEKNKCNWCGFLFSNAGHLRRHLKLHTEIKSYKCNHCGNAFSNTGNLREH